MIWNISANLVNFWEIFFLPPSLLKLFVSVVWLNFVLAQSLRYWACEPQIMSLNLLWAFVYINCIKFLKKKKVFIQHCNFFICLTCINFIQNAINQNQVFYCWFKKLFQCVVSHLNYLNINICSNSMIHMNLWLNHIMYPVTKKNEDCMLHLKKIQNTSGAFNFLMNLFALNRKRVFGDQLKKFMFPKISK